METLRVDVEKCVRICPSRLFKQEGEERRVVVEGMERCIVCGHCAAVCPTGAIDHSAFPKEKVHAFRYEDYPSPEQLMLLCRARRSNRAFSGQSVPEALLKQIVEAAYRAPTASNLQGLAFTVITDEEQLRMITEFTLSVFQGALRKMKNPLLRPLIKWFMPGILRYQPVFERLLREKQNGNDLILRGAKAVLFIHAPRGRFGCQDANLAYQNGSLMAECVGVGHFYTGFVCSAIEQEGKGELEKRLGIDGKIYAGMALGMPAFRFANYVDRKEMQAKGM